MIAVAMRSPPRVGACDSLASDGLVDYADANRTGLPLYSTTKTRIIGFVWPLDKMCTARVRFAVSDGKQ